MRSNVGLGPGEQRSAALEPLLRRAETHHADMTNIRDLNVNIVVSNSIKKKPFVINFSVVYF
mgnify:FL=1